MKEKNLKKHFLGYIYGRKIWIEDDTLENAQLIFELMTHTPRKTFWQKLKDLFKNK